MYFQVIWSTPSFGTTKVPFILAYLHFLNPLMTFSWIVPIEILSESTQFFFNTRHIECVLSIKSVTRVSRAPETCKLFPGKNVNNYNRKFCTIAWGARDLESRGSGETHCVHINVDSFMFWFHASLFYSTWHILIWLAMDLDIDPDLSQGPDTGDDLESWAFAELLHNMTYHIDITLHHEDFLEIRHLWNTHQRSFMRSAPTNNLMWN